MPDEPSPQSSIILYQTEDGRTRIQCRFEDETVWLTQKLMADLFQIGVGTVNHHLKAIFAEGELPPGATIRRYRIVQNEGVRQIAREVEHYNLDAIIAVGFRVRSRRKRSHQQTPPPAPSARRRLADPQVLDGGFLIFEIPAMNSRRADFSMTARIDFGRSPANGGTTSLPFVSTAGRRAASPEAALAFFPECSAPVQALPENPPTKFHRPLPKKKRLPAFARRRRAGATNSSGVNEKNINESPRGFQQEFSKIPTP
jgi:hypothetical protein